MGSVAFEFLTESLLFDDSLLDESYGSVSEADLNAELGRYREHIISNIGVLLNEIVENECSLRVFTGQHHLPTRRLIQSALYLDQVVLSDPIFPFTRRASQSDISLGSALGLAEERTIDRSRLARCVSEIKSMTPMVACDYLKIFPVSYYRESKGIIPLTYSKTGFSDVLPDKILTKYRDCADVRCLRKDSGRLIVDESLRIGRNICIHFRGDNLDNIMCYSLFDSTSTVVDEGKMRMRVEMEQSNVLPEIGHFRDWVNQSINQFARTHFSQVMELLGFSKAFGTSYLTSSEFIHSLLGEHDPNESIRDYATNCVLNLDLPYLENVSVEDLMSVRSRDGDAFQSFRSMLEGELGKLRTETDPRTLNVKIESAMHELSVAKTALIDQKIKQLQKSLLVDSVVAVGGLAATVVTSGSSMAASFAALANGVHSYFAFRQECSDNPSYFLWRVKPNEKGRSNA